MKYAHCSRCGAYNFTESRIGKCCTPTPEPPQELPAIGTSIGTDRDREEFPLGMSARWWAEKHASVAWAAESLMTQNDALKAECARLRKLVEVAEKALSDVDNHWHHPSDALINCTACNALADLREGIAGEGGKSG